MVLSLPQTGHLNLSTQWLIAMSVKTMSVAPRETNIYLPSEPAVKHPMGKALKILAYLVNGTKKSFKYRS